MGIIVALFTGMILMCFSGRTLVLRSCFHNLIYKNVFMNLIFYRIFVLRDFLTKQ